jgi:hypothetical protein
MDKMLLMDLESRAKHPGEPRGLRKGKLEHARATLQRHLARFAFPLPAAIVRQIAACEDLPRLDAALDRIRLMTSIDEFAL